MENKDYIRGFAYVMLAVLIWSGWVVVSRFGVKGALSSYDITAIRFATAGLILLPVIIKKGWRIGPWGIWSSLLISVLIGACYTNVVIAGMKYAPVSHASTVNSGTFLIIITLVGIHGLREHVSKMRLFGVVCSLCGISIMLMAKSDVASSPEQWFGHLLFIVGGAMWASYVLLARAWKIEPIHAAAIICVFSMVTYLPPYLLLAEHHITLANWHDIALQSFYQGVLTGVTALIIFNMGVQILGAARAGSLIPLIPAISTLIAIPVLHEYPSTTEWMGILAVSFGVFLASGAISWKPIINRNLPNLR